MVRQFDCKRCPAQIKAQRDCQSAGFENLKRPKRVDDFGLEVLFCPGKATWYPEIANLFEECRVSYETGILPKKGLIADQDQLFTEVFPFFIERWVHRRYYKVWQDVIEFTPSVLSAIGKMISKMFGGK